MNLQVQSKVKSFISKYHLIHKGEELILGVSGGADSMMLLHYFIMHKKEYEVTLKVAHVHHGLRESAELDANLVENICKQYNIPFYRHNCDIKKLAREKKISEEEAGREERYNFFISLLNQNAKIVTAHTMNDQAETMLMRFVRGTDIKGLQGIRPIRERIIRPLLCLTRKEIERYCESEGVPYRDDETNFETIYSRNKIRLQCIPYIKEMFNPSIIETLGRQSELYQEESDYLSKMAEMHFLECKQETSNHLALDIEEIRKLHCYMQKKVMLKAIESLVPIKDITSTHIQKCIDLVELQVGKEIHLPYGLTLRKDYKALLFIKEEKDVSYAYPLEEGTYYIKEAGLEIKLTLEIDPSKLQNDEKIYTKYIDYGKIKNGLQVRTRQSSDYIQLPSGTKKLKKVFTDDKISKTLRNSLPLITDGQEVVWIIGNRLNSNYYMTEQTKKVLKIQVTQWHQ